MPPSGLRIFIAHRIGYADRMYERLEQMVNDAVTGNLIEPWRNLSLKPDREYRDRQGRQLGEREIWDLAAERISDASLVLVADRPAADHGNWLADELDLAIRLTRPIIAVYDPAVGRRATGIPRESKMVYEAPWRYDGVAKAVVRACDDWGRW